MAAFTSTPDIVARREISFRAFLRKDGSISLKFGSSEDSLLFDEHAGTYLTSLPRSVAVAPVALASALADALITFVLRHREKPE